MIISIIISINYFKSYLLTFKYIIVRLQNNYYDFSLKSYKNLPILGVLRAMETQQRI